MTKNYYWLKLHFDILEDWKVGTLPDSLKWRFIQCLIWAGKNGGDGWLPDMNQFAFALNMDKDTLKADLARLASNQLVELAIHDDGGERWFVTNYLKRQKKIDSKDRVRAFRERQRKEEINNATVTPPLRNSNEGVTGRYTDKIRIDIDKNRKEEEYIYDAHEENATPQNVLDALTALRTVSKTRFDVLSPPDDIERFAYEIAGSDVLGFAEWWQKNGHYSGKPAIKSVINEWDNYTAGVDMTATSGNGDDAVSVVDRVLKEMDYVD